MPARARLTPRTPRPARPVGGRRIVIGFCGPDGAGKSSLVRELWGNLAESGFAVRRGYGYGCLLCRRFDQPSGIAGAAAGAVSNGRAADRLSSTTEPPTWRGRLLRLARRLHGHIDAAELAVRLAALRCTARLTRSAVVMTDRGPLDGLAKHDPPPGSSLARRYLRLTSRYDILVLLDAPAELLARRDGEHTPEELEHWRLLYRRWACLADALGNRVLVTDTAARTPGSIAVDLRRTVLSGVRHAAPHREPATVPGWEPRDLSGAGGQPGSGDDVPRSGET
ncbi:Thymidylate kinase [Micromonospora rhizosphaerae]|uniref:Thymidylate kinase n=1 Tax=Micromonospora rhizosphaerae TaxID=568872 RepID=A0A1C6S3Z6_9ACTN|nr:hypothetical protein [Micromonospora rhizosphaerae]SCL24169.1 Thymidylate kinase [Micromonospora rhizosphaerae]